MATRHMKDSRNDRTFGSSGLSTLFRLNGSRRSTREHDEESRRGHEVRHYRRQKMHRAAGPDHARDDAHTSGSARITLHDADHRYGPFYLSAKSGSEVIKLESWVKERCLASAPSPLTATKVRFFAGARELGRHDLVAFHPSVWFRLSAPDDHGTWRFTDVNHRDKALDSKLTDQLTQCIEVGNTVGAARKLVAKYLGVDDPNRIAIVARNGARVGPLYGDLWELRQVRSWFCTWLSISLVPGGCYLVLQGPWGDYLFHPLERFRRRSGMPAREVKRTMATVLLPSADRLHDSKLRLTASCITLKYRGSRLGDSDEVQLGSRVRFELPGQVEDLLASEESWLLPLSETCTVCTDAKKPTEVPPRITGRCRHKGSTCKDCLGQWISSSLGTSTWERLKCTECAELLAFSDVKRYASKPDFDRYDGLVTRASLESIHNFRWCLSTRCESGQIHDPACARFKCVACKARHCVHHNVPWHSGETCDEYDRRNRRRRKDDKASETVIRKTTRVCPKCKQAVYKTAGCNHITCICGHEWCYICLAPYRRNKHDFLYCRHNAGCSEIDPFADLLDPDGDPTMPQLFRAPRPRVRPPRPAEERQQEAQAQAREVMRRWLERVPEGLLPPPLNVPRPGQPRVHNAVPVRERPRTHLEELLQDDGLLRGRGRMDDGDNGQHENQPRERIPPNQWFRAWTEWEDDDPELVALEMGGRLFDALRRPGHFGVNA